MAYAIETKWNEWKHIRDETRQQLNKVVDELEDIRSRHEQSQQTGDQLSQVTSGVRNVGTLGSLFSPVFSFAAEVVATGIEHGTTLGGAIVDELVSADNIEAFHIADKSMRSYDSYTKELLEVYSTIVTFERMDIFRDVYDVVLRLSGSTKDKNIPGDLVSICMEKLDAAKSFNETSSLMPGRSMRQPLLTSCETTEEQNVTFASVIPSDIYDIIKPENSKDITCDDVRKIKLLADNLGNSLDKSIETFLEMHIEVFKVYNITHANKLYEFLEICHKKLNLELPTKYYRERNNYNELVERDHTSSTKPCNIIIIAVCTVLILALLTAGVVIVLLRHFGQG